MTNRTILIFVGHDVRSEEIMDTFTAVPSFQRLPITIVDQERLQEFYDSQDVDTTIPTKTQILIGYEKGPGTPVPVQIEVDTIESEYSDNLPSQEDQSILTPNQYADKWRRVNMLLRRNLLLAVVRGLDSDSANVLAHEDGQGRNILERLGWLQPLPNNVDKVEVETDSSTENEKEGEGEVGESISSISPQSSQESTSRRTK